MRPGITTSEALVIKTDSLFRRSSAVSSWTIKDSWRLTGEEISRQRKLFMNSSMFSERLKGYWRLKAESSSDGRSLEAGGFTCQRLLNLMSRSCNWNREGGKVFGVAKRQHWGCERIFLRSRKVLELHSRRLMFFRILLQRFVHSSLKHESMASDWNLRHDKEARVIASKVCLGGEENLPIRNAWWQLPLQYMEIKVLASSMNFRSPYHSCQTDFCSQLSLSQLLDSKTRCNPSNIFHLWSYIEVLQIY